MSYPRLKRRYVEGIENVEKFTDAGRYIFSLKVAAVSPSAIRLFYDHCRATIFILFLLPSIIMGSMFPLILPLLSSFLLAKCAPNVSPVRQLFPRANPCERSGTPVLYHDYGPDVCPGKYQLNPDGKTCPMNLEDDCEVLCQTK